jgi:FMN phosphatase YigB (HAD superfamily)
MSKKKAVVFDLDGTLVDVMKYEKHHKTRHESFAKEAEEAPDIKKNVKKFKKDAKKEDVVILTARSAGYKKETKDWLNKHDIKPDKLVMRPKSDTKTSDADVKTRLLDEKISPQFKVKKAYDDKSKNVKMFKKHGIKAKKV